MGSWNGTVLVDKADAAGTYYRRNRTYDPSTARFTQEDPIGLAGGLNEYGFASGDPADYGDPFGLCTGSDLSKARLQCEVEMAKYGASHPRVAAMAGGVMLAGTGAALVGEVEGTGILSRLWTRLTGATAAGGVAAQKAASELQLPDANKLAHVFDQAKHNWSLTGLGQAGNLDLINQVAGNAGNLVSSIERRGGNVLTYQGVANGFNVVVNVFEKSGIRELSNSWIVR
jgi:RHS repeat-associated protein